MRLRWDWLEPVVLAPYVPTLGPVVPGALTAGMFRDVVAVSGTGRFLPYDKDQRWSDRKDERGIADEITHTPDATVIPTLSTIGGGLVKIHRYGAGRPDLDALAEHGRKLCARHLAARHRIIWCQQTPDGATGRLMLKTFTGRERAGQGPVLDLDSGPYSATFPAFAQQASQEGSAFLYQRMQAGHDDGPILVAIEDHRIIGALGPLAILHDRNGARLQPPQYFAVHPDHRGRGHGRALWRASMAWGHAHTLGFICAA